MRSNERVIFLGVAIVALAIGFYLLVLGPKRDKASELKGQVDQLHASITAAEQQASYGEQARQDFPKYYGRMVVLGKAVPAEADTASLLVQLNSVSHQTKVDLRSIALSQDGSGSGTTTGATTPAAPPTSPTGAASAAASTASTASSATPTSTTASPTGAATSGAAPAAAPTGATATAAPATEASAAALPLGSVVGPAGLPTLPYSVNLWGSYFDVSNFIGKIDGLVEPVASGTQLSPDGRLLTIGGFSLQLTGTGPSPRLKADFVLNAYSTGSEGLTLGASPSAPAPASPGETQVQPASAVVAK
jgi:Tfp pilus assembly protein PilO